MIPINNSNNRLISEEGEIITKRESAAIKTCFICNNIYEKDITDQKVFKKRVYKNFITVNQKISFDKEMNNLIDNQTKLYSICQCERVAHVKCLLKLCIIKLSLSCPKCYYDYHFYFENETLPAEKSCIYYSKLFFLFLLMFILFAGAIVLFIITFNISEMLVFWKIICGLLILFIDTLIVISTLNQLKSLLNKTQKTKIKYSEERPMNTDNTPANIVSSNSQKFHYYVKQLFSVEIGNQFKGKTDFSKFLHLELNRASSYWNTLEECNLQIRLAKNELEGIEEDEEYNSIYSKKKISTGFKSPKLKRGSSMLSNLKNLNKQFSISPIGKKIPVNSNLSPKNLKEDFSLKLVLKQNTPKSPKSKNSSPRSKPNPVSLVEEENKDLILVKQNKRIL